VPLKSGRAEETDLVHMPTLGAARNDSPTISIEPALVIRSVSLRTEAAVVMAWKAPKS
jgi:hypothetical protein